MTCPHPSLPKTGFRPSDRSVARVRGEAAGQAPGLHEHSRRRSLPGRLLAALLLALVAFAPAAALAEGVLARLLPQVQPGALAEGADGFGPLRADLPVAPILRGGERIGWVFAT